MNELNERQKTMVSDMKEDYMSNRENNAFAQSLYMMIDELIDWNGTLYEQYETFSEKEHVKIMRVFMDWALETEDVNKDWGRAE
ncbi:hypothetical protein HCC36_06890 [Listeria booriae]|uniref:Uncharacterized protein n=1 Tax=Listeria booriae TaxID=1552123 RepID=A0A842GAX2_9LIST|nr:hypothetical protein [Listeria booriae]MBC2292957.1 hypothetical protein [Listeria booriae]